MNAWDRISLESDNKYFRNRISELEAEVARLREELRKALDLMMLGERMRERLMVKAICAGAFNVDEAAK